VVELICAMLFLLSFLRGGASAEAAKGCVLSFLLVGLTFTDAETHLLPDAMTLPGIGMAFIFSFFSPVPGPSYTLLPLHYRSGLTLHQLNFQLGLRSFANSVLGAVLGAGILYLIGWIYLKMRKSEGMGMGDVKLMAMAGAFLGPSLTMFVLCAASLLGGVYGMLILATVFQKRYARYRVHLPAQAASRASQAAQIAMRGLEIPFGVFLAIVSLVGWFYGGPMIRAYMGLFRISG
jgi:leader peptidase (prepilin peptidase)/N-methyltransferase